MPLLPAVILALLSTQTPDGGAAELPARYVFQSNMSALLASENAALEAAFYASAKSLGWDVADPAQTTPELARIEKGIRPDGSTCGVREPYDNVLPELDRRLKVCGEKCRLQRAAWSVTCSKPWHACSFLLEPLNGRNGPPAHQIWVPQAAALKWKTVTDMVSVLTKARKQDWEAVDPNDRTVRGFNVALGSLGSRGPAPTERLRQRAARQTRWEMTVLRRSEGAGWLWGLLAGPPDQSLPVPAVAGCFTAGSGSWRVLARRNGKEWTVETDQPHQARSCVQSEVQLALAGDAAGQAWELWLDGAPGDVVAKNGYLVDLTTEKKWNGAGYPRAPVVSDERLADWAFPQTWELARCLADVAFSEDYALADASKRSKLQLNYRVTFSPLGAATGAELIKPIKPYAAWPLSQEMERCLQKGMMKSVAPCSSAGGTADGTLTLSAFKAL